MKHSIKKWGLLYLMSAVVLVTAVMSAKEWSADQKDVLNSFNKYIAAAFQGNVNEMKSYWHPKLTAWDFKQQFPMNYDVFLKMEEDFSKNFKLSKLECKPLEIQVEGNIAILHLSYDEAWSDSTGKKTSSSGVWTSIMMKQDARWIILSNVWIEK